MMFDLSSSFDMEGWVTGSHLTEKGSETQHAEVVELHNTSENRTQITLTIPENDYVPSSVLVSQALAHSGLTMYKDEWR